MISSRRSVNAWATVHQTCTMVTAGMHRPAVKINTNSYIDRQKYRTRKIGPARSDLNRLRVPHFGNVGPTWISHVSASIAFPRKFRGTCNCTDRRANAHQRSKQCPCESAEHYEIKYLNVLLILLVLLSETKLAVQHALWRRPWWITSIDVYS